LFECSQYQELEDMGIQTHLVRSKASVAAKNTTAVQFSRGFSFTTGDVLADARARLADSNRRYQKRHAPKNEAYYPPIRKGDEECLRDLSRAQQFDAIVTRNHYGSLVLNAYHALFIDVDMPGPGWRTTFYDLCTVLASERTVGFRIYRTAAGFRVLATTTEFDPGSASAKDLMTSVGADDAFVRLCGTQQTFRARLTPKPWRCGATHPPNQFPRQSADEQRSFNEWLVQYERACCDRATCRFLEHVGPRKVHERVDPIIQFHDRTTRALEALELA
jgi:hypothetical protein